MSLSPECTMILNFIACAIHEIVLALLQAGVFALACCVHTYFLIVYVYIPLYPSLLGPCTIILILPKDSVHYIILGRGCVFQIDYAVLLPPFYYKLRLRLKKCVHSSFYTQTNDTMGTYRILP